MSYRVVISGVLTEELAAWIAARYTSAEAEESGLRVRIVSESARVQVMNREQLGATGAPKA